MQCECIYLDVDDVSRRGSCEAEQSPPGAVVGIDTGPLLAGLSDVLPGFSAPRALAATADSPWQLCPHRRKPSSGPVGCDYRASVWGSLGQPTLIPRASWLASQ